jgi:hypothetical protein
MSRFRRDLNLGNTAEIMVQELLYQHGIGAQFNTDRKKNKYFDIIADLDGKSFTLEIKFDVYAARSGNIAIE